MKQQLKRTRLHNANERMFSKVWELYTKSFPADERRLLVAQLGVMGKKEYRCEWVALDGEFAGLLFWWSILGVRFIEHLAISPDQRGKGYGRGILIEFIAESAAPILLEVEKPELAMTGAEKELRERRIKFYSKLNFVLNRHDYTQPAYFSGGERLNLYVMSYPEPLSREALGEFVYNCHPVIFGAESFASRS